MGQVVIRDWKRMPDGTDKYQAYLASREWALLKEAVRERSKGVCEHCRFAPATQTHHQTYQRIYREELADLLHVCAPCHEFLSGKRARNPFLDTPVTLRGRLIQNVYLAGKITGTTWRDEIAPGWSYENHGVPSYEIAECGDWHIVENCIPIPDGRRLSLTGPWWTSLIDCGGHTAFDDSAGLHASGSIGWIEHGTISRVSTEALPLLDKIRGAIIMADLFFAWIDSLDSFGTLWEIGFACGEPTENGDGASRVIVIASPMLSSQRDLWIPFSSAHLGIHAASPGEAWSKLWNGHHLPPHGVYETYEVPNGVPDTFQYIHDGIEHS